MKNSSNKILIIVAAFLLLTNIGLVIFMMMDKGGHDGKRGGKGDPFEIFVKELSLTEQQQKDFKQSKEDFFKNNKPLFDSLRSAKTAFFSLIKDTAASDSLVDAYNHRISEKQEAIDKLTFAHFKKVRGLLTAEQQPKFDTFVQKMMQRNRRDSAAKKDK
jgi:periplasmic protein CpxP/Spy